MHSLFAPAKLNLYLHLTGRDDAGYHTLDSLIIFLDKGDVLTCAESSRDTIIITGAFAADAPADWDKNLVGRAVDFFRLHVAPTPPLHITLRKDIPVGAGLGGGSADAAAILRYLLQVYTNHSADFLLSLPLTKLGAELPVCILSAPTHVAGIGDMLTPVHLDFPYSLVLLKPPVHASTADVFQKVRQDELIFRAPHTLPEKLAANSLFDFLQTTHQDLESVSVALCPDIALARTALEKSGALFSRMTGSGSTCFGLFETEEKAQHATAMLKQQHPTWWCGVAKNYVLS